MGPGPSSSSQYYWASSPSYSLGVFKLLDSQPELRLVEFLLPSRVTPPGTLKEFHILLVCRFWVVHEEVKAVLKVSHLGCSERIELLYRLLSETQNLLGGVPLFGEDFLPLASAESNCHLLSPQSGVSHLGGHEGSLLGLLNYLHSEVAGVPPLPLRLLEGWLALGRLGLGGLALLLLLLFHWLKGH